MLRIEGVFTKTSEAEDFAEKLTSGEKIINGELVEIRIGLTGADLVGDDN